jgi:methylated-DNA-[protein]-cysteine S-methyltransferase
VRFSFISTPIGQLLAAKDDDGALTQLHFAGAEPGDEWQRDDGAFGDVTSQLRAYFAGELRTFELTLAPRGTQFQQRVWRALLTIPYGETRSYANIADSIGKPSACRAVGAANGANPIPIVIPCHRVIGSGGALTGFGGGIDVKRRLLALEGADALPLFG